MVAEEPVEVTGSTHTWCSGGHGALGHPKVFINLDKGVTKSCGYCGKQFRAHWNVLASKKWTWFLEIIFVMS